MVCADAPLGQVHEFQQFIDCGLTLFGRDVVQLGVNVQVFLNGQVEVAGQGLRDHADRPANVIRVAAHIMSANSGRSRSDGNERGHHADQRGLPRSVRTQQPEDFFFFDVEGNIVDRGEVAVLLDDMIHFNGIARVDWLSAAAGRGLPSSGWCRSD